MKKIVLQSLAILGINVVAGCLCATAFLVFIFRGGDPVLAAVPAVFALPAVLLQPWYILFVFKAPGGLFAAPFLTTVVSIPLYVLLDRKGKLDRVRLALARLKNRRTALVVGCVSVCVLAVGFARYVDFPVVHRGIPASWALERSLKELRLDLGNPRHYCLGSFMDYEWLWQVSLSEQDLKALTDKLGMQPLPSDQIGDAYLSMPPYWWRPVISDQTRVLATTEFPMAGRGQDGWHALATWSPKSMVLHMWIKDNFM